MLIGFRSSLIFELLALTGVLVNFYNAYAMAKTSNKTFKVEPIPVTVTESGIEDVEKFATVIVFYVEIERMSGETMNVTVSPDVCCLVISPGDIDCGGIIELRPPVHIVMGPAVESGRAQFMFRNLYVRYRMGNCTFAIYSNGYVPWRFKHTIQFNTYPKVDETTLTRGPICLGVDQDPDRFCSPVDCAIKYQGKRNFYRNSTMKCEAVVKCDTRGSDGISVVAYYDWENNVCHPLNYILDDGVQIEEKDVVIPAELDPAQNSVFPDFEPHEIKRLMDSGKYNLKCNHGIQKGMICECDSGWMSSGVHQSSLLEFRWCDRRMVDTASIQLQPKKLSLPLEIFLCIILGFCNVLLLGGWLFSAYIILQKTFTVSDAKGSYTLLKQVKTKPSNKTKRGRNQGGQ